MGVAQVTSQVKTVLLLARDGVDVQKVVKECEVCKISKTANKNNRPPMGEQRVTERAGQRLFMGPKRGFLYA